MSSRDTILAAIRAAAVPPSPSAPLLHAVDAPVDLLEQFLRVLVDVGGHGIVLNPPQSVDDAVVDIRKSLGTDIEPMVVRGQFAVAENGAVYVDSADIGNRTDIVRSEHVVITVPRDRILPTMHEAMRRVPKDSACGWFLSGPSKTADIEQSLVIGAQGARTLHVVIEQR